MTKIIALILFSVGILLIGNVAFPIFEYELSKKSFRPTLLSPLSETQILGDRTARATKTNLIKASNWFEGAVVEEEDSISNVKYYTLSIPKLKIDGAKVEVGGEDLSKNLIHYKGTALPGKVGNVVIFGHSILPQFFNPKNYLSIFSTLPKLEKGDKVTINYDGVTYTYKITEMFEVPPTAVEVLRQYNDGKHLTLITCVPPGTYLRRLVVRADLVPLERI